MLLSAHPSTWASLQVLEEVKIPSSVTKIEFGSFYCYGTMIFIPSSVNTMWGGVGCIDGDDFANSFLAFESTSYPTFKKGFLDSSESYTETNWISTYGSVIRTALGVDSSKVEYSDTEKSYYYKELEGYSLFAVMDLTSERLNINANFNKATVHTIRPNAVKGLFNVRTVKIGDGISKIQGKAFDNLSLTTVLIPKSVTTINAYGFDGVCSRFLIEASSQPSEWDSYWAGSNTSSCKITYSVDVENVLVYSDFIYEINGTKVTLVSYIGTSTTIRIPRTIEGKTVTKIKTGFASTQSSHTVYIPSTVITIESKAFTVTSTSSYAYFYFEAEALLTTYANDFFYNSYYGSTNYKYTYFNRSLGY